MYFGETKKHGFVYFGNRNINPTHTHTVYTPPSPVPTPAFDPVGLRGPSKCNGCATVFDHQRSSCTRPAWKGFILKSGKT